MAFLGLKMVIILKKIKWNSKYKSIPLFSYTIRFGSVLFGSVRLEYQSFGIRYFGILSASVHHCNAPKKELGRAIGILVLDFMYPASKYVRHKYVRQIIDTNENHKMIHIGIVFILPETSKKHPYRCHFCTIYFMTIHFLE